MMILGILLSALAGVSLGLLGGGGSILVVPILLYILKMDPHQAIVVSLFVVGVTSTVGFTRHAREGNVYWGKGLLFLTGGMLGAFGGGRLGAHLPGALLVILFAGMMLVTALAMLRGRKKETPSRDHPRFFLLIIGFMVGGFTGMVGAGGGFLVVPALVLLASIPMKGAVGTSLLVIALQSFAGLTGYLTQLDMPWKITLAVAASTVMGSFLGVRWSQRMCPLKLRAIFAYMVLAMAVTILLTEAPNLL